MEHTTKILISTLHLKDFTAAELARFAEAKPSTVNSVLTRNSHLFKRVLDDVTPRRRGGRTYRYQLRSDSAEVIREKYSKFLEFPLLAGPTDPDEQSNELSQPALTAIFEFVNAFPISDDISNEEQDIRLKRGLLLLRSVKNLHRAVIVSGVLNDTKTVQINNLLALIQSVADYSKLARKYQRSFEPTIEFLLELLASHTSIQRRLINILTSLEVSAELKNMADTVASSRLLNFAVDIESIADVITSNTNVQHYKNLLYALPVYARPSAENPDDIVILPKKDFTIGKPYVMSTTKMSNATACATSSFVEASSMDCLTQELQQS